MFTVGSLSLTHSGLEYVCVCVCAYLWLCVCVCCCQAAQVVLISLFELNTPEFTMLLGALPKTFQDGATKLLHSHLRNSSATVTTQNTPRTTLFVQMIVT